MAHGPEPRLGRRPSAARRRHASLGLRPRLPAGRRHLRDAPRPGRSIRPSWPSTSPACAARPTAWRSSLPDGLDAMIRTGIADLLAAEGLAGPDGDASIRITVSRGPVHARGLLPPDEEVHATIAIQAWPVPPPPADHLARGLHLVASAVRRDPENPLVRAQDHLARGLRLRPARGAPGRRRRRPVPDHRRAPLRGHDRQHLPGPPRGRWRRRARHARPWTARSCPARRARGCSTGGVGPASAPVEGDLTPADLAAADEAFLSSSVAGILPVTRFAGAPIGTGRPGPWTRRARADREALIQGREPDAR